MMKYQFDKRNQYDFMTKYDNMWNNYGMNITNILMFSPAAMMKNSLEMHPLHKWINIRVYSVVFLKNKNVIIMSKLLGNTILDNLSTEIETKCLFRQF